MPIDTSIYANAKQPQSYSLGDIMSLATGAQNLQTGKIRQEREKVGLEQDTANLGAQKAIGAVVADPQYHDPETGLFDLNKASPAIIQADPQDRFASKVISSLAKANADQITVKKAALGLADTSRAMLGSAVGALATKPDLTKADVAGTLAELESQAPDAKPIIEVWKRGLASLPDDPKALQQVVMKARAQVLPPGAQIVAQNPSGIQVDNGQQSAVVNTNTGAGPVGAVIPGTAVQKQLPPTTPVFDAATGTPGYLGPTGRGAPPAAAPAAPAGGAPAAADGVAKLTVLPKPGFVPSGPKLGAEANVAGSVDVVNKDWAQTSANAASAPQNIGVLQNIKKYAAGAVTGVTNDRRAFFAGLAGLAGMAPGEIAKTDTDLLAKNSAMLAQQGGNTDLARLITEAANPNAHMTKEAIEAAANQVIAQQKLAIAKQQYLGNFKTDPEHYTQKLAEWNSFADPRVLQLPDMSREEKARMKAAMSPTEQRDFGRKIREMQARGLVQ